MVTESCCFNPFYIIQQAPTHRSHVTNPNTNHNVTNPYPCHRSTLNGETNWVTVIVVDANYLYLHNIRVVFVIHLPQ